MTNINGLGKNYVEEYKEFGEKVLIESEQVLKKAGVIPTVFNNDLKTDPMEGLKVEHTVDDEKNEDKKEDDDDNKKTFKQSPISSDRDSKRFKSPSGSLNSAFKEGNKASVLNSQSDSGDDNDIDDVMDSAEKIDGDDNDLMKEFMETEYKNGNHLNGGGYVYHENSTKSTTNSLNANVSGSYNKDKFSMIYGGSIEYSDTKQKSDQEDKYGGSDGANKTGSAVVMAKYDKDNKIVAIGGSAYLYDNNMEQYNIGLGASINQLAVTLRRRIQVARDTEGKKVVNNQTDVKFNILKPKKAGDFTNTVPDIPTPSETQEYASQVDSEKQEVDDIINQKGEYGFGLDLEISTASDADEYGVLLKHTSLLTKKDDKKKKITITPYVGIYDYHPNSQEGLKLRIGAEGNLDIITDNNVNITSKAIIDNKRIMQSGSQPQNTFMAALDTTVTKNKFSATVSTGYINSNTCANFSYAELDASYEFKNSSLSLVAGYQFLKISEDDKNKIFHTGLRYAVNF